MKRLLVVIAVLSLVGSSTLTWALLPHFNAGDVLHAVDLNDIVDVVNALRGETPHTLTVDCNGSSPPILKKGKQFARVMCILALLCSHYKFGLY